MNSNIKIERITEFNDSVFNLLKNSFIEVKWSEENLKMFLSNLQNIFLIARDGDIGCGLIRSHVLPRWDNKGIEILLHEMDVVPAYQRQGIALNMIEELKNLGKEIGASEIWVLTNNSNTAAMGLYQKAGMNRQNQDDVMFSIDL